MSEFGVGACRRHQQQKPEDEMKSKHLDEIDEFARARGWMVESRGVFETSGLTSAEGLEALVKDAESRNAPGVSFAELRAELARQRMRNEIAELRNTVAGLERTVALLATESMERRGVAAGDSTPNVVFGGSRVGKSEKPAPEYAVGTDSSLGTDRSADREVIKQAYEGPAPK